MSLLNLPPSQNIRINEVLDVASFSDIIINLSVNKTALCVNSFSMQLVMRTHYENLGSVSSKYVHYEQEMYFMLF